MKVLNHIGTFKFIAELSVVVTSANTRDDCELS